MRSHLTELDHPPANCLDTLCRFCSTVGFVSFDGLIYEFEPVECPSCSAITPLIDMILLPAAA